MKRRDTTNSPHRILLVDDDSQVAKYLTTVLEENGYSVTAATSGKEALASLRECRPDLLILDLNMPELDGSETFRRLRAIRPEVPVVFATGYVNDLFPELLTYPLGTEC